MYVTFHGQRMQQLSKKYVSDMEDLNPDGACGNAAGASASLGEAMLERGADGLAKFIAEFHEFSVS